MANHVAQLHWQRAEQERFTDNHYSRRHRLRFDGEAELAGSSSPSVVPLPWSDPAAVDPEELFVASLASCHMLWFLSLAATRGWCVDDYRDDAIGTMACNAQGQTVMTVVTLRPRVRFSGAQQPGANELHALHEEAHAACYIANSVKTKVRCEPIL